MGEIKVGDRIRVSNPFDCLYQEVGAVLEIDTQTGKLKVKIANGPTVWYPPDQVRKV